MGDEGIQTERAVHDGSSVRKEALIKAVAAMSLGEKIGQLFMVSFSGRELSPKTSAWLAGRKPGGVMLLGDNVTTRDQSKKLIHDLHRVASRGRSAPLLIAVG